VTGLSSSIPLLLNTPGNFLIEAGLLPTTIPVTETLGSPLNLAVIVVYLVVSPAIMWLLRPRDRAVELHELRTGSGVTRETTVAEEADAMRASEPVLSDRLNNSAALQLVVVAMGLAYLALHFARRGFDLNLNIMIFSFLVLGLLLHRTPIRYVVAMGRACSNISGIVFQYPFYAGIMGIMMITGLGKAVAAWMASLVTLKTLPVAAFVLGGVVNFSIPSAGGEWAVIGPPLVEAVRELAGTGGGGELSRADQPPATVLPARRPSGHGCRGPHPGPRHRRLPLRAVSDPLHRHRSAGGVPAGLACYTPAACRTPAPASGGQAHELLAASMALALDPLDPPGFPRANRPLQAPEQGTRPGCPSGGSRGREGGGPPRRGGR
jgi:hypothetical protein